MEQVNPGFGALAALLIFIAASVWLGTLAQRVVRRSSFMKGYFLGNRGLGSWAVALTATVQSGGTFMGFPSLVYTHGWIVALWIAAYMVVPVTAFGVLGKRFAQLTRRTGAITAPDLFRERFGNPTVGLAASLFTLFYMTFMMVAQFKAGAIVMKLSLPGTGALALAEDVTGGVDLAYYIGLVVFTITVVGYTLIGGFLAAVWTDMFQSVMMFFGVLFLLLLAIPYAGGMEAATRKAVEHTSPNFAFGPGFDGSAKQTGGILPDQNQNTNGKAASVRGSNEPGRQFHTLGLAFSYFFVWVFAGLGSPASMVRVMACKSTETIRRSIFMLSIYNSFIYLPLVMICICARAIMPDLSASDEVIPRVALKTTSDIWGGSFLAGLILAAPFGAVMATVSSYLVVIASGLVRDVYQRFLNPAATTYELKRLSYVVMVVVGAIAILANIKPVQYLQAIVVFSGTSLAGTFAIPALMAAYWRRATAPGALAGMIAGAGSMFALFCAGWILSATGYDPMIGPKTSFRPYFLLGLDPIVWGLSSSLVAGVMVSLLTKPLDPALVSRFFDAQPTPEAAPPQPTAA